MNEKSEMSLIHYNEWRNPLTKVGTAVAGLIVAATFALTAMTLCGCGEETAKVAAPEVTANLKELADPNEYEVRLSWGETSNERFVVYRRDTESGETASFTLQAPATTFTDTSVKPGRRYVYTVSGFSGEAGSLLGIRTLDVPTDVVVSETSTTERLPRVINRLFLRKGAILRTGRTGADLQIRELIADDATLQTYAEDATAKPLENGADAGAVTVRVQRARGRLRLENRGQTGAPGASGVVGVVGAPGAKGNSADFDANPKVFIDPWGKKPHPSIKQRALNLLKNYKDDSELRRKNGNEPWFVCTVQPGDGQRGGQGGSGSDGGNGTAGGASARVMFSVLDTSDFHVDVANEGGRGGAAGRGGAGGTGGPGGTPGDLDPGKLCTPAKTGDLGAVGNSGKDGQPGKSGFRNPVCLKLGDRESEGCAFFTAKGEQR